MQSTLALYPQLSSTTSWISELKKLTPLFLSTKKKKRKTPSIVSIATFQFVLLSISSPSYKFGGFHRVDSSPNLSSCCVIVNRSSMASFTVPCPKTAALCASSRPTPKKPHQQCTVAFKSSSVSSIAVSAFGLQGSRHKHSGAFKVSAQLDEVTIKESSNCAPVPEKKLEKPADQDIVPDESSITAFLSQVQEIIELVDSRDIMELQLKQQGCELLIRKKGALQQQAAPAPMVMMQSPSPQAMMPYQMPQAQASAPAPPTPAPAPPAPAPSPPVSAPAPPVLALPSPAKPKSSHPPMKCPMAGTFYRCPAPGSPPFVKEGDKVQKGQIVCVIEAMKLFNEIEADRSGTVVEVLVGDAKPVSIDMPLFVIEP